MTLLVLSMEQAKSKEADRTIASGKSALAVSFKSFFDQLRPFGLFCILFASNDNAKQNTLIPFRDEIFGENVPPKALF